MNWDMDTIVECHFVGNVDNEGLFGAYLNFYCRNLLQNHLFKDSFCEFYCSLVDAADIKMIVKDIFPIAIGSGKLQARVKEKTEKFLLSDDEDDILSIDAFTRILSVCDSLGKRDEILPMLFAALPSHPAPLDSPSSIPALRAIKEAFELSEEEVAILLFLILVDEAGAFSTVVRSWTSREYHRGISICTGIPIGAIHRLLALHGKLIKESLVEIELCNTNYEINTALKEVFIYSGNGIFQDCLLEKGKDCFELDSFAVDGEKRTICSALLGGDVPVQILFYGSEGSSKTEFSKALVKSVGKRVLFLERSAKDEHVLMRLKIASNGLAKGSAVIVVDEADDLLGNYESKAEINLLLENIECPIIWIANSVSSVHASTLRRFAYALEFNPLSGKWLSKQTEQVLAGLSISETVKTKVIEMSGLWGLNASTAKKLKVTLEQLSGTTNDENELIAYAQSVIQATNKLITGKVPRIEKTENSYDISALSVSVEPLRIVTALRKVIATNSNQRNSGLRILFHGISGSGKSELARYLAENLDKKLAIYRGSDLMDAFVGSTEKNIAQMFSDAEASGNIILLDEVESFLYDRSRAVRSWELSQIDEFLTQMEQFHGIMICTTNFLSLLDKAVIRRFSLKVEFFCLKDEGVKTLLASYFPQLVFSDSDYRVLASGLFVPADFSIVKQATALMDDTEISTDFVIETLIGEAKHRKPANVIGFCA